MTFLTSRTAVLTYQDCPRRRFYTFHVKGHGITGSKLSLDLLIGTITHRGLQNLLEHSRVEHDGDTRTLKRTCINQSVEVARTQFFSLIENSNGISAKSDDYTDLQYKIEEAWAICEALIRSYALWRLPQFGEFYEVLEVEKEEEFWLQHNKQKCEACNGLGNLRVDKLEEFWGDKVEVEDLDWIEPSESENLIVLSAKPEKLTPDMVVKCPHCVGQGYIDNGILFQAKADGLLRGRQDNKLYVLSFKTARDFTDLTMKQILHDMQGMSEIAAIEDRLNREYKTPANLRQNVIARNTKAVIDYFQFCTDSEIEKIECHAVQYEYLLKGRYQQDPWNSGIYKWQNPLIHCWKNCGVTGMFSNTNVGLDYKWKAGKGRQPQGWEKINIWEDIGVENWIDKLLLHEIQPEEGDVFQNLFRSETINRDRSHIEEWKIATLAQEARNADVLHAIEHYCRDEADIQKTLMQDFPKHTNRCHDFFGNDCPFVQICHENVSPDELLEAGVMIVRQPHHENEREEFQKKGFIK